MVPDSYSCYQCGHITLTTDAKDDFEGERFTREQRSILSIWHRNEYERRDLTPSTKQLTLDDLKQIISDYRPLDAIEKMDNALYILDHKSSYIGQNITISIEHDYPLYRCIEEMELKKLFDLLIKEELIILEKTGRPSTFDVFLSAKGYQRLRSIKERLKDSRQCFVAMWFADEMSEVYDKAIKPAIEYIEDGETEPRFMALKINDKEHTNDINDEIISQIRRSRYMVCDLTGYRGGVYFEAGFAYGLGLEVIYTCRKDWIEKESFIDQDGNEINELKTSKSGQSIPIAKEGIHFDLEHRNRIEWEMDKLEEFKEKLTNRIKAVIV